MPLAVYLLIIVGMTGLALFAWIWWRGGSVAGVIPRTPAATVAGQSPTPDATDIPGDGFGVISGPATPWAVVGGPGEPTATAVVVEATPVPTEMAVSVLLQGPPAGSFFRPADSVTFYWTFPEALGHGRQFVVYLLDGEEQLVLGVVSDANLGEGYQLQAVPGQIVGQAGNYSWLVVLEDEATGAIIGSSEPRLIAITGDN